MAIKLVKSSTVQHLDYNEDTSTLSVQFNNGSTYMYYNVLSPDYKKLEEASSIGKHLHKYFKGTYQTQKVDRGTKP